VPYTECFGFRDGGEIDQIIMKILWVNAVFLHPTTKGGQIRTLGMLTELHKRHEIHYVAFENAAEPEGVQRAGEYSTRAYPVAHRVPSRRSAAFAAQVVRNLVSPLPLAVSRYQSAEMATVVRELRLKHQFDSIVCDFLFPAPNLENLEECVLFEHNVETAIWQRHAATARDPVRRLYFGVQAKRMLTYEREVCRQVARVIAVSEVDAAKIQEMFEASPVAHVSTGVDVAQFTPEKPREPALDLVFIGSMDWMANIDGVEYFTEEILPIIHRERPACNFTVVGRRPTPRILQYAREDPRIRVTGTVPDVRPYLWDAAVSIVPLRIGSGTRLKIYESMAARVPVVSTTVGAEGLEIHPPHDIRIADTPAEFARQCLELLEDSHGRGELAKAGWELVSSRFSWEQVTRQFEAILQECASKGAAS
jgi:glycosyltransferase involved in cell wall biosynthesis